MNTNNEMPNEINASAVASAPVVEKKLKSIKKKIETDLSNPDQDNLQEPSTMNSEMNAIEPPIKIKKPRAKKAVVFAEPVIETDAVVVNVGETPSASASATEEIQSEPATVVVVEAVVADEDDERTEDMPLDVWGVYKEMRTQYPEADAEELSEMAYAEIKTRKFKDAMTKRAMAKTALSQVPEQRATLIAIRDAEIHRLNALFQEECAKRQAIIDMSDEQLCELVATNPEIRGELGIVAVKVVSKKVRALSTAVASASSVANPMRATPTKVSRDFDKLRANDTLIHSIGDKVWEGRWTEGKVQLTKTTTDDRADAFLAGCKCYKLAVGDRVRVGHQFASVNSWFQAHNALYNSSAYQKQTILAIKVRRADGSIVSIDEIVR